ncbi:MAG: hypothetical protein WKF59_04420 [Chitinophagaceae bacterium]
MVECLFPMMVGKHGHLTSNDNNIRQRAWYYTKVFVDPKNENTVYAPNVGFMRSRDGGKTFTVSTYTSWRSS